MPYGGFGEELYQLYHKPAVFSHEELICVIAKVEKLWTFNYLITIIIIIIIFKIMFSRYSRNCFIKKNGLSINILCVRNH